MMPSQQNFVKHFSNKLTSVVLDVYDSWGNLGTIFVNSRTGISMILYIKKVLQNCRPISTYIIKFVLLILKNRMQETLYAIIGEHWSEVIENIIIVHSFYYLWHNLFVK